MLKKFSLLRKFADREVLYLIAKLSLGSSIITLLFLIFIVNYFGGSEEGYSEIVKVLWVTSDNLPLAVLTIGSFMVALVAIMVWLLCLYSSFRLVGPLYRLQKQLGLATSDKSVRFTRLRKKDSVLLKVCYHSVREAIRVNKVAEDDIKTKLDKLTGYLEKDQFSQAEYCLGEIKNQLARLKL